MSSRTVVAGLPLFPTTSRCALRDLPPCDPNGGWHRFLRPWRTDSSMGVSRAVDHGRENLESHIKAWTNAREMNYVTYIKRRNGLTRDRPNDLVSHHLWPLCQTTFSIRFKIPILTFIFFQNGSLGSQDCPPLHAQSPSLSHIFTYHTEVAPHRPDAFSWFTDGNLTKFRDLESTEHFLQLVGCAPCIVTFSCGAGGPQGYISAARTPARSPSSLRRSLSFSKLSSAPIPRHCLHYDGSPGGSLLSGWYQLNSL